MEQLGPTSTLILARFQLGAMWTDPACQAVFWANHGGRTRMFRGGGSGQRSVADRVDTAMRPLCAAAYEVLLMGGDRDFAAEARTLREHGFRHVVLLHSGAALLAHMHTHKCASSSQVASLGCRVIVFSVPNAGACSDTEVPSAWMASGAILTIHTLRADLVV